MTAQSELFALPRKIDERFDGVPWNAQDGVYVVGNWIMVIGGVLSAVVGALAIFSLVSWPVAMGSVGVSVLGFAVTKIRGGANRRLVRQQLAEAPATYFEMVQSSSIFGVAVFGADPESQQDLSRIQTTAHRLQQLKGGSPAGESEQHLFRRLHDERSYFATEPIPEDYAGPGLLWSVISIREESNPDLVPPGQPLLGLLRPGEGQYPELVPLPLSLLGTPPAGGGAGPSSTPGPSQHYVFAHRAIPGAVFHDPKRFFSICNGPDGARFVRDLWTEAGKGLLPGAQRDSEGLAHTVTMAGDTEAVVVVHLPAPGQMTEAYFVAVIGALTASTGGEPLTLDAVQSARVFTLEQSHDPSTGAPLTMLGEWTEEGTHMNYGDVAASTEDAFVAACLGRVRA